MISLRRDSWFASKRYPCQAKIPQARMTLISTISRGGGAATTHLQPAQEWLKVNFNVMCEAFKQIFTKEFQLREWYPSDAYPGIAHSALLTVLLSKVQVQKQS
jgi:hypothetical protein